MTVSDTWYVLPLMRKAFDWETLALRDRKIVILS
jgi:hypothetical protein